MPVYICPECNTKLKRNNPVEAGKKLKCPECSHVFTVRAVKKAEPAKVPAAPAAPAAPKSEWDDDGPKNYMLTEEAESKDSVKEREKAYGPLGERFEKGKRGPALDTIATRLTMDQLVRQVLQGGGNMPAYGKNLNSAETAALVGFLGTLHPASQAPAQDVSQTEGALP